MFSQSTTTHTAKNQADLAQYNYRTSRHKTQGHLKADDAARHKIERRHMPLNESSTNRQRQDKNFNPGEIRKTREIAGKNAGLAPIRTATGTP